ncbi:ketopantoate reductase family protein [Saccharibacillus sp. JS10]|uniref:ketopantoate reductase family protein n=1 Tax=Saccharibacillus sp. JS10 TaxID=2950552 RepID=UPI002108ACBA|nr:ketopantoate reductase family protein [Saccharibacillus sp. JS10]MCQ4086120.1 ketopantoate reductase family protein [Saccharibacillus sp. JS10]
MKIEVIGGGSLGLLFAAIAAKGSADVLLYTRTSQQAEQISTSGIGIEYVDDTHDLVTEGIKLEARAINEFSPSNEEGRWIILAVKQKHVDAELIAKLQQNVRIGDRLFCLQNGIGHIERLSQALPHIPVYAAITTEGARKLESYSIRRAGVGTTRFGQTNSTSFSSEEDKQAEQFLIEVFTKAGLPLATSNSIETVIYRKLLINAIINPLTAIWKIENGALLHNEYRISIMKEIFDEIVVIYEASGLSAPLSWWDDVLQVCESTAANRSSMLEDVTRGDSTEVAWISGGIVKLAHRFGVAAPWNQKLLNLIEGMNETESC